MYYYYFCSVFFGGVGLGLLTEFYGMPHHFVCLVLLLKTERKKLVCGSADLAFFAPGLRILAINKRIRGFEKHRGPRITAEKLGPDSGLRMSRSSDYGSGH